MRSRGFVNRINRFLSGLLSVIDSRNCEFHIRPSSANKAPLHSSFRMIKTKLILASFLDTICVLVIAQNKAIFSPHQGSDNNSPFTCMAMLSRLAWIPREISRLTCSRYFISSVIPSLSKTVALES